MQFRSIILAVPFLALAAPAATFAQVAPVTPIERANADAAARLYATIATEQIAGVEVAQIIDRVEGHTIMMQGLTRAEQIGGPREVADGIMQVRLQISGARAAQLLLQAVAANPTRSPVPLDRLAFRLRDWGGRTFTGTGDNYEPAASTQPTTASAPLVVTPGNDPTTRPINAMQLVPGTTPVVPNPAPAAPSGPGRASARPAAPESPAKWRPAPAWVSEPVTASASAPSVGSPLRTARSAEAFARDALRVKLAALPVGDGPDAAKLGDDLDRRPDIAAALDDAVNAARVSSVDYRADGSVEVRLAVGGQRLWQRFAASR